MRAGVSGWPAPVDKTSLCQAILRQLEAELALLTDAAAFRAWLLEAAADSDLAMVCVAHGDSVLADAAKKLKEALRLYERTLADRERLQGSDHPDTILARSDVALATQHAQRNAQIEDELMAALERWDALGAR